MGKLILINTAIGNDLDLSARVLESLESGKYFAVEDTRRFKELLKRHGITYQDKFITSYHDHTNKEKICELFKLLAQGDLYVASDAGSPIVSDPAYELVVKAYEQNIEVESYSGVSSVIQALELSALPPTPFQFHGFLPRERGKVTSYFSELSYGTHFFFESPKRICATLKLLAQTYPLAPTCVLKELSKTFQTIYRFQAKDYEQQEIDERGEFVLAFHVDKKSVKSNLELHDLAQEVLNNRGHKKTLSKLLAKILESSSKDIYNLLGKDGPS